MATGEEILETVRAFQRRFREAETPGTDNASRCVECGEISPYEFERSSE
jgi:hypothetical protein